MTKSYAVLKQSTPLVAFDFSRRQLRENDIKIDILYCGICHTDLHIAKNEWHNTIYPVVPGHEIIGVVSQIGSNVKNFEVGEIVGVGCLVGSCQTCESCSQHLEQYCEKGNVLTYNSYDPVDKSINFGGYSTEIVVDQKFVLHVPKEFKKEDLAAVAPLLCAGITTYSPLKHWKVGPGQRVGIVGLGGLGHMGIKIAKAMGAEVFLFTSSPNKVEDAKRLGAHTVVISKDTKEMKKYLHSFDFILDTVAASHSLDPYVELLKREGTLCLVGVPDQPHPSPQVTNLIFKRRHISGSLIGGIKETQEMLDFCAKHHLLSDIELIPIQKINESYERLAKSDVKYRFVIDNSSLKN